MELASAAERSPALEAVFKPVQRPSTFEETVERLGTAIRLGLLQPASRLPPERDLADRLRISRSTLRQALTTLVQSGHLVSVRGRAGGTFVSERPPRWARMWPPRCWATAPARCSTTAWSWRPGRRCSRRSGRRETISNASTA
ncbi:MAG: GntR family transcriptional regulator [Thermoleophilaceae bacterium]|nr:GntR family transcriptional regulator [Thermoleophilaceae bacterium]